jgi:hypothetical protein
MRRLSSRQAQREIDEGIASTTAAIGDPGAVAPFFRIPGLDRSKAIEAYASSRGLMVWSADLDADDWTRISPAEVVKRTLKPLERRGRGLIELHDIHERTASALPKLLAQFKRRGYHMVHVKPVRDGEPKTAASAKDWRFDP